MKTLNLFETRLQIVGILFLVTVAVLVTVSILTVGASSNASFTL